MVSHSLFAAFLSLIVPGLGQMYRGNGHKGAAILVAAIVIANLNILPLPLIAIANPAAPVAPFDSRTIWAYWIPRVVHDVASFWSVAFWIWAVVDAFSHSPNSAAPPVAGRSR